MGMGSEWGGGNGGEWEVGMGSGWEVGMGFGGEREKETGEVDIIKNLKNF